MPTVPRDDNFVRQIGPGRACCRGTSLAAAAFSMISLYPIRYFDGEKPPMTVLRFDSRGLGQAGAGQAGPGQAGLGPTSALGKARALREPPFLAGRGPVGAALPGPLP